MFMTGIDSTALKATFLSFKVFLNYGQYSEDYKIFSWEISVFPNEISLAISAQLQHAGNISMVFLSVFLCVKRIRGGFFTVSATVQ